MEQAQNHMEAVSEAEARIMRVVQELGADDSQNAVVWDLLRQLTEHAKRGGMYEVAQRAASLYGFETNHPVTARVGTELLKENQ